MGIAKELMNQAAGMDRLDAHLDRELDALAAAADGPEFAEGIRAFFDKGPPRFATVTPGPSGLRPTRSQSLAPGAEAMHEYSIVQAMFDQIEARATERNA